MSRWLPGLFIAAGSLLLAGVAAVALSLGPFASPRPAIPATFGCTLEAYIGPLTADGDSVRFSGGRWGSIELKDVRVSWPSQWTTRRSFFGGTVEVVDARGQVAARTGTVVSIWAASTTGSALMEGDTLVACPMDPLG